MIRHDAPCEKALAVGTTRDSLSSLSKKIREACHRSGARSMSCLNSD